MDPLYPTDDRLGPDDAANTDNTDNTDDAEAPVQTAVRTLLQATPDPGPMPADLSRRIEDSLARAAVHKAGDDELFDELGFGEPGAVQAVEDRDDVIVFGGADDHDHNDDDHDDDHDDVVPLLRRRWPLVGVAAAGVALLALAGGVLLQQRSGNDGLAAIPPSGSTTGSAGSAGSAGSVGSVHVQVSNTDYTKDGLVAGAQALIASPGPDASVGDAPSAGPLVTQSGAAACVGALGARDAGAVSIDVATYEGQPAAIVVVRRSDSTAVYAVQRDCGDGDAGVLQDAVPVP
jgi:hypothetical protein